MEAVINLTFSPSRPGTASSVISSLSVDAWGNNKGSASGDSDLEDSPTKTNNPKENLLQADETPETGCWHSFTNCVGGEQRTSHLKCYGEKAQIKECKECCRVLVRQRQLH